MRCALRHAQPSGHLRDAELLVGDEAVEQVESRGDRLQAAFDVRLAHDAAFDSGDMTAPGRGCCRGAVAAEGCRAGNSGGDGQEPLVQLALVVEDRLAELVRRPGDDGTVAEAAVAAGEGLVAVARRVEEVDRRAARDAVARRPDVDRHVVHRHDVGRLEDVVPAAHLEREVVQLHLRGLKQRDVVVRLAQGQPGGDGVGIVLKARADALGREHAHDLDEELLDARRVVDPQEGVVKARRADADHVPREGVRVVRADLQAPGRHVAVELDLVAAGQGHPDAIADLGVLAGDHALDRVAEGDRLDLDRGNVLRRLALEAALDHADAALFENDRVVVPLVPALEVRRRPAQGSGTAPPCCRSAPWPPPSRSPSRACSPYA